MLRRTFLFGSVSAIGLASKAQRDRLGDPPPTQEPSTPTPFCASSSEAQRDRLGDPPPTQEPSTTTPFCASSSEAQANAKGESVVHRSTIRSAALQPESLVYLPADFKKNMPLLVWLHGASLRGNDVQMVKRYGPPAVAERRGDFPFVVLSPQCPPGQLWTDANALIQLVNEVMIEHRIDRKRVYLTGLSMGGGGAWFLASQHNNRFGAVVPMCGPTQPALWAKGLKKMPIWCFHGEKDDVVPLQRSKDMIKALKKVGSKPKFTIVKGKGHDITGLYNDDDIYKWILSKKIRKPVN